MGIGRQSTSTPLESRSRRAVLYFFPASVSLINQSQSPYKIKEIRAKLNIHRWCFFLWVISFVTWISVESIAYSVCFLRHTMENLGVHCGGVLCTQTLYFKNSYRSNKVMDCTYLGIVNSYFSFTA